jgi:hypothetical protein
LVHCVPASPQNVPSGSWFVWQVPDPLQVSGLSHCVSVPLPHGVPEGWKPLSWQMPPRQVSWFSQTPGVPQNVPFAWWLTWQVPRPSQVSASSQELDEVSPQELPAARFVKTHEEPLKESSVQSFWSSQTTVKSPSSIAVVIVPRSRPPSGCRWRSAGRRSRRPSRRCRRSGGCPRSASRRRPRSARVPAS